MTTLANTNVESTVRRLANRHGYIVRKSRQRKHVSNLDNYGEYMLVDAAGNFPVLGWRFDATLDDIKTWFKRLVSKQTKTPVASSGRTGDGR